MTLQDLEAQQQREPFLYRSVTVLPAWWAGERDPRELRKYAVLFLCLVVFAATVLSVPFFLPPPEERKADGVSASVPGSTGESSGGNNVGSATSQSNAPGNAPKPQVELADFAPFGQSTLVSGARFGAVAADHPICSRLGLEILSELGGNAVDAAVSTTLCQGVLSPFASGVGGGCLALIRLQNGTIDFIDARETAPENMTHETLRGRNPESTRRGGLSIAVPGELRGLELMHSLYGRLPWKQVVLPVVRIARNDSVGAMLARRLEENRQDILGSSTMCEVFCDPTGTRVLQENETLTQPALASTLEQVASKGSDYLYHEMASTLAAEIQNAGGLVSTRDLREYRAIRRQPLQSFYRGFEIFGAPLPSSGGASMAMALNILEGYSLPSRKHSNESLQLIVEALKYAFASRSLLGDADFVPDAVSHVNHYMLSKSAAAHIRETLDTFQTRPADFYFDAEGIDFSMAAEDHGTTHLSVLDAEGNAVALTSTINLEFGSMLRSSSSGIVFNDEIDDFSIADYPNAFGIVPMQANYPAPRKRPLSSMSPTIVVRNGRVVLVVGGSGGPRIISSTLQVLLNILDFGDDLAEAISLPRVHHQLLPNVLWMEALGEKCSLDRLSAARSANSSKWARVCNYMRELGHQIEASLDPERLAPEMVGCVQAVLRPKAGLPLFHGETTVERSRNSSADGVFYAVSDPRKKGLAAAA
jgi:gamma-glutamyltranspeptidase